MAKFCTKCGKPLGEGETCTCEFSNQNVVANQQNQENQQYQANQQYQTNQQYQAQPGPIYASQPAKQLNGQNVSNYLKNLFQLFKKILCYPVTDGATFATSEDRNSAFGFLGAQAIITALFALAIASKVGSLLAIVGSFAYGEAIKMPYFRIFVITVIASFALSCALAGILYGVSYLFKNKISFKVVLCAVAIRSVILVPISAIAFILSFLNVGAGILLFYMGNIAGICYMAVSFPVTSQENKNKVAIILFISFVVFLFVSLFIMGKCAPYYVPDTIKESIKTVSKLLTNPSEFFKGIMGGLY